MDSIVNNREIFKHANPEDFSPQEMRFLKIFLLKLSPFDRNVVFTLEEFKTLMSIEGDLMDCLKQAAKLLKKTWDNSGGRKWCCDHRHFFEYIGADKDESTDQIYVKVIADETAFPLMIANDINKGEFEIII